jgi:hypothetical protein
MHSIPLRNYISNKLKHFMLIFGGASLNLNTETLSKDTANETIARAKGMRLTLTLQADVHAS